VRVFTIRSQHNPENSKGSLEASLSRHSRDSFNVTRYGCVALRKRVHIVADDKEEVE